MQELIKEMKILLKINAIGMFDPIKPDSCFLYLRLCMLWILLSILPTQQTHAQVNSDDLKGAVILQICENIKWPDNKHEEFVIGFLSDDNHIYKALKSFEGSIKVRKKKLKLVQANRINDLLNCNTVYFNKSDISNINQIFELARENNILVITDNYDDPLNVHVNLMRDGNRMAFKINMANLTLAKLAVEPNILLNGGSVVDIKTAFEEFDTKLNESRNKLSVAENKLQQKEKVLQTKDELLTQKESTLQQYALKMDSLSIETQRRTLLAEKQKQILKDKESEVKAKNAKLELIYQDIESKQEKLNQLKNNIENLQEDANLLKSQIIQKNKVLNEKEEFIDNQRKLILLFVIMLSGFMIAAFIISRLFLLKRRLNLELQHANNELQDANEELNTKNEIINERNTELFATLQNLKETQNQLIQAEKMASLGVLTTGVAHEINNPLNFILGSYHVLKEYFEEHNTADKELTSYALKSIKEGVERASNIVKGLNDLNVSENNHDETCLINNILDNCLLLIENKLNGKVSIIKDYQKNLPSIHGNSANLHQAFLNILMNALQAIDEAGQIKISTQHKNGSIIIEISDNGQGISEENLARVTDPFFTTKSPGEGTGLGLSISYNIIQEHHGELDIKSELGEYTSVTIYFPAD